MPSSDQISRSEPSVGQRAKRRLRNAAIGAAGVGLVGGKVYKGGANWKQAAVLGGVIGGLAPPRDSVLVQGRKSRPSPFRFSAYIGDVKVKDLPPETRELIGKFIKVKPNYLVARYGMVLADLIPKSDPANLSQARAHVSGLDEDDTMSDFEKRRDGKFILVLNDRVIDGHHFIATAEKAGVTSSLNVLDLTPVRFQQLSAKDRLIKWVGAHPKTATGIAAGAGGYVIGRRKRRQSVDINVIGAPTGEQKVQLSGLGHSIHTSSQMLRRQESHDPAPATPMKRRKNSARQPIPLMVDHRGAPANWEFEEKKDKVTPPLPTAKMAAIGATGAGVSGLGGGAYGAMSDVDRSRLGKLVRVARKSGGATSNERRVAVKKAVRLVGRSLRSGWRPVTAATAVTAAGGALLYGGASAAANKLRVRKHELSEKKDKSKLRNARDAALTAGGVTAVGAAGVVGYKALKAGRKVAHQVKEGVAQTVQNSAGAAQDVRDLIKNQVAPTMEKTKQAAHVYGSALDAVRPVVDSAAPIVKKGSIRAARTIRAPGNVVKGYKVGLRNPNRKSRAYKAGRASKDILPNPKRLKADTVGAFKEGMDGGYHIPGRTSKSYKTGKLLAKSRIIRKVMKRVGLADGRTIIQLADVEIDPHRKLKKQVKTALIGAASTAAISGGVRLVASRSGRNALRGLLRKVDKNDPRTIRMRNLVKKRRAASVQRGADKAVAQARAEWTAQAMPKPPAEPGFVDAAKNVLKRAKKKAVNKVANIGNDELGLSAIDRELLLWSDNGDYEDPRFQHQKARRQLTAEEHAQIKQDRRKLLVGTAAGGAGALALAGYLGQDTKKGAKIKKDINREVVARYKAAPKGRKLQAAWRGAKRLFSSLDAELLFYTPTQATDKKGRRADPVRAAVTGQRVYVGNTNAAGERVYERIPILHHQTVDSTLKKARGIQKWAGRAGNLVKDTAQTIVGKPRQKDSYGRTRKREWEKAWFKNTAGTAVVGGASLAVLRHARANSNGKIAKGLRAGRKLIHKASKIFNSAKLDGQILLEHTKPGQTYPRRVSGTDSYVRTGTLYSKDGSALRKKSRKSLAQAIQRARYDERTLRPERARLEAVEAAKAAKSKALTKSVKKGLLVGGVTAGAIVAARKLSTSRRKQEMGAKLDNEILLGDTAPDWDVRDQRGKSARVFAPGSRPRLRREKEWHEKSDNERKLWKAATAGALLTGAGVTSVLYRGRLLKVPRKVRVQVKKVKGQKPPTPTAPTVQHSRHNGMNQPHQ